MVRRLIAPPPVNRSGEFDSTETIPLQNKLLRITLNSGEVVYGYFTITYCGFMGGMKSYSYCIEIKNDYQYVNLSDVKSYSYMKQEDGRLVDRP